MILNEPEASLHPDLLAPLARLMLKAAERCQLIVVPHARPLVDALNQHSETALVGLEKRLGETIARESGTSRWRWPGR